MTPALSSGGVDDSRRALSLLLPGAGLLVAGWASWGGLGEPRELLAKQPMTIDSDRDGLPDRQELVHRTDPLAPDTDSDGFSDGEEFTLGTDPLDYEDFPADSSELSLGMTARGEGGKLMLFAAAHLPDGNAKGKTIRFGCMIKGEITEIPFERLLPWAEINKAPGLNGGEILTFDIELPSFTLLSLRRTTYFMVIAENGQTKYCAAAKADLTKKDGVVLLRRKAATPEFPGGMPPNSGTTIHVPIPPNGDGGIPVDWHPGQVCYQTTQITGVTGAVVTHEVVEAHCDEAWETYCESDCEATVGSTYQTIDPGVLLGG